MRRWGALLLALALTMCFGVRAMAQEDLGVEFGGAFLLDRPASLEAQELTADDVAEGMVYAAIDDELELYVRTFATDGRTKDELYDEYRDDEFLDGVEICEQNGVEYLKYRAEGELGAVFMDGDEHFYEIVFYCVTDDALNRAGACLQTIRAIA
ncbi:hypothetical protein ACH6CV_10595 [Bacillota bacterium Meth-B3]|nr:hypothetical protein [Christensenellaceae bacterium]MEA5064951.1 hypothetical protein [Eubacteriales bacterium]MEA5067512.1 hypothetical protein [Christensenellaceae bacterium]